MVSENQEQIMMQSIKSAEDKWNKMTEIKIEATDDKEKPVKQDMIKEASVPTPTVIGLYVRRSGHVVVLQINLLKWH